jgi:alkanesulfonate monooxygenase SsuD/methylene tetrahydromethanopterin reductase-like flavin-dependent oxidoreductase (luciferase family)
MLIAIAEDESEARDIAARGMNGLVRRTHAVHRWDVEMLGEEAADAALGPLRKILGSIDGAVEFGAGTAEQIRDRFAEILDEGLTEYIVLQIPTGDMTFEEARRTLDVFATKVKPDLEIS